MSTGAIAWNTGGYPGSDNYLALGLSAQDAEVLRNARVTHGDKPATRLSIAISNQHLSRGSSRFPDDYVAQVEFPVPYIDSRVTLYVPKHAVKRIRGALEL